MNVFEKSLSKTNKRASELLPSGNWRMEIVDGKIKLRKTYKSLIEKTIPSHIFINDGKFKHS
jgi:hypothetical protein